LEELIALGISRSEITDEHSFYPPLHDHFTYASKYIKDVNITKTLLNALVRAE